VLSTRVERLSEEDRNLVQACLAAAVEGPYFPDCCFQTLMAADRAEVASVLDAWPDATVTADWVPDAERLQEVVVNNVLLHLVGYPHGQWQELSQVLGADETTVWALFRRYKDG